MPERDSAAQSSARSDTSEAEAAPRPRRRQRREHTRARTGCERCRARRRKCDEVRPQCQRCKDAGVACQYVVRLTFLDQNTWTLPSTISSITEQSAPVQFVSQGPQLESVDETPPDDDRTEHPDTTTTAPLSASMIGNVKHYITHVAPWLDAHDLRRAFGLIVPRLALDSPALLKTVLQLSAASSGAQLDEVPGSSVALAFRAGASSLRDISPIIGLQSIAAFVFARAGLFVQAVPETWTPSFHGSLTPNFNVFEFTDTDHQAVWLGLITLLSRLDIAYSLMYETAPTGGSGIIRQMLDVLPSNLGESDALIRAYCASLRGLALLIDVMALCLDRADEEATAPPPLSRSDRITKWNSLLADLRTWYAARPRELLPIAETEGDGNAFPTVVFTNIAGVSANMVGHAAMFLLLSHRPRMPWPHTGGPGTMTAAYLSPQWHARYICGIAISSAENCWDPCMLASLAIAARRMTHPDQQREVFSCLDRVKTSGWQVDGLAARLRTEWGPW